MWKMVQSGSLSTIFIALLATLALAVVFYFKWTFTYWKRKGFPYLKPTFSYGNFQNTSEVHVAVQLKACYGQARLRNLQFCGIYLIASPQLLVTDLELVKNILTENFDHFSDRGLYYNEKDEPMEAHLIALEGAKWRLLRAKSTPAFTSNNMKNMFPTLAECVYPMLKFIDKQNGIAIDVKDLVERYTMNVIGSCAFGLEINTFEEPNSLFRKFGLESFEMNLKHKIGFMLGNTWPALARKLHVTKHSKALNDFFTNIVVKIVEQRKRTGLVRNDFLQIFMDMTEDSGNKLSTNEIVAQSYMFFTAGFVTSYSALTFALYEIAKNHSIQNKLKEEIDRILIKHNGKITYEAIHDMEYLDQVFEESLRKYPPVHTIVRECVKEYQLPGTDLTISRGTKIAIPVYGIHNDPEYYPEPHRFDPDRFSEENKKNRHQYANLAFGKGPRICIGLKFGMLQSKVCLAHTIMNYKLTVRRTIEPEKLNVDASILAPRSDAIWLDFTSKYAAKFEGYPTSCQPL